MISADRITSSRERPTPLAKYHFSTRHLPESEQFTAWRDLCAPIAEVYCSDDASRGFQAEQVAWDLGGIAFIQSKFSGIAFARTSHTLRADPVDHWFLAYAKSGAGRTVSADRVSVCEPGTLSLKSLTRQFEGIMSKTNSLYLFIPRDFCRDAASTLDAADNTSLTAGLGHLLADYLLDLERRLPMLTVEELPGLLATTRTMVVACAVPTPDRLAEAQKPLEATLLERARRLIQQNLHFPTLGADELCRELGVSRSRLYRLFEPMGGVAHYIRYRRLLDAHAALCNANDDRRITEIAAERGFFDAAEFSRAFKREFGYRPTDARSDPVHRLSRSRPTAEMREGSAAFGDLLHRLQNYPLQVA
jgi:AraC-like DNA-binding protein